MKLAPKKEDQLWQSLHFLRDLQEPEWRNAILSASIYLMTTSWKGQTETQVAASS